MGGGAVADSSWALPCCRHLREQAWGVCHGLPHVPTAGPALPVPRPLMPAGGTPPPWEEARHPTQCPPARPNQHVLGLASDLATFNVTGSPTAKTARTQKGIGRSLGLPLPLLALYPICPPHSQSGPWWSTPQGHRSSSPPPFSLHASPLPQAKHQPSETQGPPRGQHNLAQSSLLLEPVSGAELPRVDEPL